jgi:deoxycytidylate deaminase
MEAYEFAKRCAMQSKMKWRHGAVILYEGAIISYGWNHVIKGTETGVGNAANSFHAEVDALCRMPKRYRRRLPQCTMIVVCLGSREQLRNSKPCENCRRTIESARIGKTFYSV